jgi:hypothetical protein
MPLTRRNFLIRGSLSLAAGALSSALVEAKTRENVPADFKEWESVCRQFELAPGYIHFGLFFFGLSPETCASGHRPISGEVRCKSVSYS